MINQLESIMDNSFGRPGDKEIEKEFMKRIRGDKLQTINAECELEICLAFQGDKKERARLRNARNSNIEEENTVKENQIQVLQIGQLEGARRQYLTDVFRRLKQSWKFEEIEQDKPLPDHFFDDGCDLSYILFNIRKEEGESWQQFKAEELIFLELLCLEGRSHLTQSILEYYKTNMAFLVEAMKIGLTKIEQKKYAERNKSGRGRERTASEQEHFSSIHETQNNMMQEDNGSEAGRFSKKKGDKKKVIQKNTKGKDKKKGKKDKDEESSEMDGEEGLNDQNQYPHGKELALKTVNYISWAYWYIIEK